MSQGTDKRQRDLAEALEENPGKPVFEYSDTPQTAARESGNRSRPKWRKSESLLFIAPLLFVCLVFASPIFNKVRTWSEPSKRQFAWSCWVEPKTPEQRIRIQKLEREQVARHALAEEKYQRDLATWRFCFVTVPKMAPILLLGVGIIGITMWFIRLWKQGNQYLK